MEGQVDFDNVQEDQDVYGSDGERIGGVAGISVDADTDQQILEVSTGLMSTLYIPRREVAYAVLGQPVRLAITAAEARERFAAKPNVL